MSFEELRAFLVVVDQGSFLSAAVSLGVSRTTLRRQVDALEARAGVPLLQRDRKGVALTEAGRKLVRTGRVMEAEFSALLSAVRDTGSRPAGEVRLLLPLGLPPLVTAGIYRMIRGSWPEVQVRVRFRELPLAGNLSDVDVVAWFGAAKPQGAWETRTFFDLRQRLFASASYLAAHGTPRTLADLESHDLMAWMSPDDTGLRLHTRDGASREIHPALATSDVHLIHEYTQLDLGIAWAPDAPLAQSDRATFVPLLEHLVGRDVPLRVAVPRALAEVPKVRLFMEHLESMRQVALSTPPL